MTETSEILKAIGQASYVWDIAADRIDWSENFLALTGLNPEAAPNSARSFQNLLSVDSPQTRFAAIHEARERSVDGASVSYQCVYAIHGKHLPGGQILWIEDTGRWYPASPDQPERAEGIVRIINERRNREETLRRKSEIDDLTGLANRRMLQQAIGKSAEAGWINSKSSALLLVSLCDLERINHIYGFNAGDEVLRKVSRILGTLLRNNDMATRFSGAKFGLIIRECNADQITTAANRILSALNGHVLQTSGGPVALKVAIGGCLLPLHARTDVDAIAAATSALDQARNTFGTSFCLFNRNPGDNAARKEKATLLARFVECMERDAIRLAYQPIVNAQNGRPEYYEALLRLDGIDEKEINNADFLKLAEGLGLMRLLDGKALSLAIDVLTRFPSAKLSANVSHDSLESSGWLSQLHQSLSGKPEVAERLIIEITESHLPTDLSGTGEALKQIKRLGCKTAIDDFGAGYTSFAFLRDLDLDLIKIDGSYTRSFKADKTSVVFIKSVREMASAFNMKTIVEWVEDLDTAMRLRELGHDYFQGSLYGMPLSARPWEDHNEQQTERSAVKK